MEPIENSSLRELFKGTLGKCHFGVGGKPWWQARLDIEGKLQLSVAGKKADFHLNLNIHVICWKHGREEMLTPSYECDF